MQVKYKSYPLLDEFMRFDEKAMRYILTANGLRNETGIDLMTRLNAKGSANPQSTVNGFLNRISVLVYKYICEHSMNSAWRRYTSTQRSLDGRLQIFFCHSEQASLLAQRGISTLKNSAEVGGA